MTTYGHFTLKDYEGRKDNPFLEQHGHWYRITETYLVRALDRVNYQAEECDAREVQAWLAEKTAQAEQYLDRSKPSPEAIEYGVKLAGELGLHDAGSRPEPVELETGADFDTFLDELEENYPATMGVASPPSLTDYAREHGWAGVGRISNKLREAYKAEFGE